MRRRNFYVFLFAIIIGLGFLFLQTGCVSKVSRSALDKSKGTPYRCSNCGYLTRSKTSLTFRRCPRCYAKKMVKISEEDMEKLLKKERQK